MRETVGCVLGEHGFDVVSVGGGAEAMAALGDQEFDAIVTDLQ